MSCEGMLQGQKEQMGQFWQESMLKERTCELHIGAKNWARLNEKGQKECEIIYGLLAKNHSIEYCPMIMNVVLLLLMIVRPGEAFDIVTRLIESSDKI
jgi:hypothetical protein